MRALTLAGAAALFLSGSALAQPASPTPEPTTTSAAATTAKAATSRRSERVCKQEPIANSRLKSKKVCMSRAEHERMRNAEKLMVREQLQSGGVQAKQN